MESKQQIYIRKVTKCDVTLLFDIIQTPFSVPIWLSWLNFMCLKIAGVDSTLHVFSSAIYFVATIFNFRLMSHLSF